MQTPNGLFLPAGAPTPQPPLRMTVRPADGWEPRKGTFRYVPVPDALLPPVNPKGKTRMLRRGLDFDRDVLHRGSSFTVMELVSAGTEESLFDPARLLSAVFSGDREHWFRTAEQLFVDIFRPTKASRDPAMGLVDLLRAWEGHDQYLLAFATAVLGFQGRISYARYTLGREMGGRPGLELRVWALKAP